MAHTNSRPIDFTAPINENGSIITGVKQALIKTFRALAGKNILVGSSVPFSATAAVTVAPFTFQVKAGKQYRITGKLLTTSDATSSGIKVGFALPGSSGAIGAISVKYISAAAIATQVITTTATATGVGTLAVLEVDLDGYFVPDVSGLFAITAGTNTGTTAGSVNVGSNVAVYKVRG